MHAPDFSLRPPSSIYLAAGSAYTSLQAIATAHENLQKVVLATGVFDLLHTEHQLFLKKAKEAGKFLVVAVESDARTQVIKGPGRPLQNEQLRLQHVLTLPFVDTAFLLPEDFDHPTRYEELIWQVRPHVYAVSSHTEYLPYKQLVMEKYGGKLEVVHQFNSKVSTSILAQQHFSTK